MAATVGSRCRSERPCSETFAATTTIGALQFAEADTPAMAARLLGVSQTALERWIASGDVPILITPSGRRETTLHALLELIEAVRDHRTAHPTDRHPLGAVLRARRAEAQRLDTSQLLSVRSPLKSAIARAEQTS